MARILVIATLFALLSQTIDAQTTEFTYQGELSEGAEAADGTYDFEFSQYSALAGGIQIGPTLNLNSVPVDNGIFTVQLDFGDIFGNGTDRFLAISVRETGGGGFTPLTPRQPISSTPYAQKSLVSTIARNADELEGFSASDFALTTDPRLSNDRNPLPGSLNYVQNRTTTQTSTSFNISGNGTANIFNAGTQFNLSSNRFLSSPGTNNTFVGIGTGTDITSGERNTFVGRNTGSNTTTGNRNTFVGSGAGFENIDGTDNSLYGYNTGLRITSGSQNSIFGVSAGGNITTGYNNSIFGYEAGLKTTTSANSFFGQIAGRENTSGTSNSFFGKAAGENNVDGNFNAFFGESSGRNSTTGSQNSFIGRIAGFNNTQGSKNTFIGSNAGRTNTIGESNTAIGENADVGSENLAFATAIGAGAVVTLSSVIQLGREGLDVVRIGKLGTVALATGHLCTSPDGTISLCPASRSETELHDHAEQQSLENQRLQASIAAQQEINDLQNEKLERLERELEALRQLVCSHNPTAETCVQR